MMLVSNAGTPEQPVPEPADVFGEAAEDVAVAVAVLRTDVVNDGFGVREEVGDGEGEDVGDAEGDVGGAPLDPVNAALTALSNLLLAVDIHQAGRQLIHTPPPTRRRTICLRHVPQHDAPKRRKLALDLRNNGCERRRAHEATPSSRGRSRCTDVHLDVLVRGRVLCPVVPNIPSPLSR